MGNKLSFTTSKQSSDETENIQQNQIPEIEQNNDSDPYLADTESDHDYQSDDDDDDEDLTERLRILEDAKRLKQLAVAFLHPELPVEVDSTACARCYFDRPSAPQRESLEETEEHRLVLEEATALKQAAVDYMHPEVGVVTSDPTATARCYFDRPSAPQQETPEEAEERRMVLEEAAALKRLAVDYMHPEIGVVTSDPTATARCYFDRSSGIEQESLEEAEERRMVLEEAAALKRLAVDYMHPEIGVVTTDPTATARCYFDRPSAPLQESHDVPDCESEQVERKVSKEVLPIPASKNTGVKILHSQIHTGIPMKSPSIVNLFGLEDGQEDTTY